MKLPLLRIAGFPAATLILLMLAALPLESAHAEAPRMGLIQGDGTPTAAYEEVVILHPAPDSMVFDNNGNVAVQVGVAPALRAGHAVELVLDGRPVSQQRDGFFRLSGIDRGTHSLQARVLDAGGGVAAQSEPVIFHVWRASRLF